MARLNVRPSYVASATASRSVSPTPVRNTDPDQENHDPAARRMDKGKERASDTQSRNSFPTPTSDEARGQKRKRVSIQVEEDEDLDEEEARFNRYFDPNQDPEKRRQVKRKSRALEREFAESRDDLLRDSGVGLKRTIDEANEIYKDVKQTSDAMLDSRLLVNVSDLAYKKTASLVLGDSSTGVDIDEFLSKCLTFMRHGGPLHRNSQEQDNAPSTSRRRRTRNEDDSEDDDDLTGEALDWEVLGRQACFPHNARPPVPSFLLGPLSVEKKQRAPTQRRAKEARDNNKEKAPETLNREDLQQGDENSLTTICTRIRAHIQKHIRRGERAIQEAGCQDLESYEAREILAEHKMLETGGISLFEYVVNPASFGQTVENLFYISFLIKEGSIGIANDSRGLPGIQTTTEGTQSLQEKRKNKSSKHQAVFSLDYTTWQQLVHAFEIEEPMVPHRRDDHVATQPGARGWYT